MTSADLVFAATARCQCGAGLAYQRDKRDPHGSWECSACLLDGATTGVEHDPARPFIFWNVKSEIQPSANGQTTRPAL